MVKCSFMHAYGEGECESKGEEAAGRMVDEFSIND